MNAKATLLLIRFLEKSNISAILVAANFKRIFQVLFFIFPHGYINSGRGHADARLVQKDCTDE